MVTDENLARYAPAMVTQLLRVNGSFPSFL
jgi:hypothetical protein